MPDTPLNDELVGRILENLKSEPSDHLHDMLTRPGDDQWSPEALAAARLLLAQRASGTAAEPVYRTAPISVRRGHQEPSRPLRTGDAVLAPDFSLPRGFARLLFLARLFQSGHLLPGKLGEISSQAAYIYYYSGKRGWVRLIDVQPLTIDVGTRVHCRWRGQAGIITHWNDEDEKYYVCFDDGHGEWSTLDDIEVPIEAEAGRRHQ